VLGWLDSMQVSVARAEDCRAIAEVHVSSWQQAYKGLLPEPYLASLSVRERETMWQSVIDNQLSHVLLSRDSGRVLGFVAYGKPRDDDVPARCMEILALYVHPDSWSTGVGRRLWLTALTQILSEGCTSITLWVFADNQRAIRFYERAGFHLQPGHLKQIERGGIALNELRYLWRHAG
jgi:ribosomal protein S18 acetylase RimI-like enzyme